MDATLSLTLMGIPVGGLQEDITINLDTNDFGKTGDSCMACNFLSLNYCLNLLQLLVLTTQFLLFK